MLTPQRQPYAAWCWQLGEQAAVTPAVCATSACICLSAALTAHLVNYTPGCLVQKLAMPELKLAHNTRS
jgi:hypothetical protein